MGERMWYESIKTPWLKLNYLSGSATRPSLSDPEQKTLLVALPLGVCSPRLHQTLLSEEDEKRIPSSRCSPRFPSANERRKICHGEERKRVLQEGLPQTTPDEVKNTWRSAARIQPVESTAVDGITSFMTACTLHLEEEKEKERSLEAELLQRKHSLPLRIRHTRTTNAILPDGKLTGVNRCKSKVVDVRQVRVPAIVDDRRIL